MSQHQASPHQQEQPSPQPPSGYKNAKAEAKAAKAYAKAQRPWYKKKRIILPLALIAVIAAIAISNSGGGTGGNTATPGSDTSASSEPQGNAGNDAPEATGPTAKFPIQNGDWRLDSVVIKNDGLGDFGGRARITYTGDDENGGNNLFTVTVFKNGKDIAALDGSANTVMPGKTVTVDLISTDKYVKGPYRYDFQNNL